MSKIGALESRTHFGTPLDGVAAAIIAATLAATLLTSTVAEAQKTADIGFKSVGRAAPLARAIPGVSPATPATLEAYPDSDLIVGPFRPSRRGPDGKLAQISYGSAFDGATPQGIQPLPVDLFTRRTSTRTARSGPIPATSAATALGDRVTARRRRRQRRSAAIRRARRHGAIASPTIRARRSSARIRSRRRKQHYEALLAETPSAAARRSTHRRPPRRMERPLPASGRAGQDWYADALLNQTPTILSLLTPEYQTRVVRALSRGRSQRTAVARAVLLARGLHAPLAYHGVTHRRTSIIVTPKLVQIMAGGADNFVTDVNIGREFNMDGAVPRLGADVPRWYGETIGFWDEDALDHVDVEHPGLEVARQVRVLEQAADDRDLHAEPRRRGQDHRPQARGDVLRPRSARGAGPHHPQLRQSGRSTKAIRYVFIECVPTIYPVKGRATPVSPGTTIEYKVPDMYGRPWAQIWEKYYEQGMERPEGEDIFSFK